MSYVQLVNIFRSILVVLVRDTPLGYLHCTQVESQIAKDSQIWLFLTILAIWLSAYTKQRQPSGVSLKRTTKMLLKNVDQLNIGHSRLILTTYYKFGKIFPCILLREAKKKLHTLENGPTSIPKKICFALKLFSGYHIFRALEACFSGFPQRNHVEILKHRFLVR